MGCVFRGNGPWAVPAGGDGEYLQSNPTIASAGANSASNEAYRQQLGQTRLGVTANISAQNVEQRNALGNSNNNTGQIGLTAIQPLLQGGFDGIPAGVRVALGNVALAYANYKTQESGVFTQTVNAYMGVLQNKPR